jgi:hypothetical protein
MDVVAEADVPLESIGFDVTIAAVSVLAVVTGTASRDVEDDTNNGDSATGDGVWMVCTT